MSSAPPPPPMDACDREAARRHALAVRRDRARMLADVTAGTTTIAALLARSKSDPIIAQTRVHAVLRALPGWGNARSTALLSAVGIAPGRRCRGLGFRQKSNLLAALDSMSVTEGGAARTGIKGTPSIRSIQNGSVLNTEGGGRI